MLGSAPTSALFFTIYDTVKVKLEANNKTNRITNQIIAANLGEITACVIRVPVDVVKQRSQAQLSLTTFKIFKDILLENVFNFIFKFMLNSIFICLINRV